MSANFPWCSGRMSRRLSPLVQPVSCWPFDIPATPVPSHRCWKVSRADGNGSGNVDQLLQDDPSVEHLESRFTSLGRAVCELFRLFDCKSNLIDGSASLISHFKLERGASRLKVRLDGRDYPLQQCTIHLCRPRAQICSV